MKKMFAGRKLWRTSCTSCGLLCVHIHISVNIYMAQWVSAKSANRSITAVLEGLISAVICIVHTGVNTIIKGYP